MQTHNRRLRTYPEAAPATSGGPAGPNSRQVFGPALNRLLRKVACLHRDQRGTISLLTVFSVLLLAMLLGMVMNAGRHVDGKIRMQNAADAVAYSGAAALARGMNTLAFTNHLLCEILAMNAYMEEASHHNAEDFVTEILDAWRSAASFFDNPTLSAAFGDMFLRLATAIKGKEEENIPGAADVEQQAVDAFTAWGKAYSEQMLPLLETILQQQLIPEYQRAVVLCWPDVAQTVAVEVARNHGTPDHGRGAMIGTLWRTSSTSTGVTVGGSLEASDPSLPAIDPCADASYLTLARAQRYRVANWYLERWNYLTLRYFREYMKMSQFYQLWQIFTNGYLNRLVNETYVESNLPHIIQDSTPERSEILSQYTFIGTAHWKRLPEMLPGLYTNPSPADAVTYAAASLFVPQRRLEWLSSRDWSTDSYPIHMPGVQIELGTGETSGTGAYTWYVGRYSAGGTGSRRLPCTSTTGQTVARSDHWTLWNQYWTVQLVPATQDAVAGILQTSSPNDSVGLTSPSLGSLQAADIERISTH